MSAWGLKLPTGFPKVESSPPVAFTRLSESTPDIAFFQVIHA